MVKHLLESLKTAHVPMKGENQRAISRFARLMTTINKLEDRMEYFKNEMSLFAKISEIIHPPSCIQSGEASPDKIKDSISDETNDVYLSEDEKEKEETHISGFFGDAAKKAVMGDKIKNFREIYEKMKEKKKEHVDFLAGKIKEIMKEMTVFKELDNPRLLYLLRKVQKLKAILISLLPERS